MVEFLLVASLLLVLILSLAQISFLYAGKGAVETAAHFAARSFALSARSDFSRARADALRVASEECSKRPCGGSSGLSQTVVQVERADGRGGKPSSGEAWVVRLTHAFELTVPMVSPILYAVAPLPKIRLGRRFLLYLRAARVVTVE